MDSITPIKKKMIAEIESDMTFADEKLRETMEQEVAKIRYGRRPFSPEKLRKHRVTVRFNDNELQEILQLIGDRELAEAIRELTLKSLCSHLKEVARDEWLVTS